jgi:hypothetical protein
MTESPVEKILNSLPERPLTIEEVENLEKAGGIERATGCAGGSKGETGIVLAGGDWMIGIAYSGQWELVDSIVGDCMQERVIELSNRTATYAAGGEPSNE